MCFGEMATSLVEYEISRSWPREVKVPITDPRADVSPRDTDHARMTCTYSREERQYVVS